MALATLSIDIIAKLASLEAGLDKANRISKKHADDIEKRWAGVGRSFKAVGELIGAAFVTQQLSAFIDRTIDGLDKLNDVADATGSTVEKISALEDIGARTGTGLEAIEGAMVKVNAALKEADGKNGVSVALKQIGLDAAELRKLDPADAILKIALAFNEAEDDGGRARVVQELFGKSVREVAPFLKDLAEAGKLNATVTKEQAAEAERLNKEIFALQKSFTDAGRSILSDMLPAVNDLIDRFKAGAKEGKGFFRILFEGAAEEGRIKRIEQLTESLYTVNTAIKKLKETKGEDLDFLDRAELEGFESQARSVRAELDKLRGPQLGRRPANEGGGGYDPAKRSIDSVPTEKAERKGPSEAERYLENLQKQIEKTRELSVADQALIDIQQKRIKEVTPAQERQILALAKQVDQANALKAARDSEVEATTRQAKAQLDNIDRLEAGNKALREEIELIGLDAYGIAAIEKARLRSIRTLKEEELARRAVAGVADEQLEALEAEIAALKERESLVEKKLQTEITANTKPAEREIDTFAQRAAENIQDQIANGLYDGFTGRSDDILASFGDLLLRMAVQAQAAQLGKMLFGESLGGSGSGLLGNALGSIAGYLFGGSGTVTGATGDFSRMDRGLYQAAEGIDRVPHDGFIAQLHKDEKVVPARYRDSGGGGVVNNITIKNEAGDVVQASATTRRNGSGGADIEAMVKRITRQTVVEEIGSGGQVDRAMRNTYNVSRSTPRRT